jgi:phosphate acetyltransferase
LGVVLGVKEQRFFEQVYDDCRRRNTRIAFPESGDDRVVDAVNTLADRGVLTPVLLVEDEAPAGLHDGVVVDHVDPDDTLISGVSESMGMSRQDARERLYDPTSYAMGLVNEGRVDGVVCGANHPTKTTYSAALQIIGAADGVDLVSSSFLMFWHDNQYLFADCALNIDPSAEELASIASETVRTARRFDMSPRVAMLSYSTDGSGGGDSPERVRRATSMVEERCNCNVDGEIQFDAAFSKSVREIKVGEPGEPSNIFIFPSLDAANIGYKIAERMGGASAVGPITQGLAAPVNDLSRGSSTQEIVETAAITARSAHD